MITSEEVKKNLEVIVWKETKPLLKGPCKTIITSDEVREYAGVLHCETEGGPVPLSNVDKISAGSLMAAKLAGLEVSSSEVEKATTDFFSSRGVKVVNVHVEFRQT